MSNTISNPIFRSLDEKGAQFISLETILASLSENGILLDDQRVQNFIAKLKDTAKDNQIDTATFDALSGSGKSLFEKVVRKELVIPGFVDFSELIRQSYAKIKCNKSGEVASYIPQLARVSPDHFAVSVCTIDGQRLNLGHSDEAFTFQSSIKPILYCAALEENGTNRVHAHVGREPSGLSFNELTLNPKKLPHNPMINAGAIMTSSLIQADKPMADRFDYLSKLIGRLAGGSNPGFDNATFHSEKDTADRNFALAHYMREMGAFPEGTDILETLELYFSACSLQTNAQSMAALAATIANGGVCPLSDERVFDEETIKNCLSMMYSCGMYEYSGEFAFTVGIPAKSGVSGAILAVIPNVMGIAVWSPSLDEQGNSVRGVEFLQKLVQTFNFHNYDNLVQSSKLDPRRQRKITELNATYSSIYAASTGDVYELKRLVAHGHDLDSADYDGRTPLHLAAAEGQLEAVEYLLNQGVHLSPKDRWNNTPMDDAQKHQQSGVVKLLSNAAPIKVVARTRNRGKAA
jgi:glutaminase